MADDRERVSRRRPSELSLPASAVAVLQKLPMHRALIHCGGHLAAVEARFNDTLTQLAYTNQAMGRVACHPSRPPG